MRGKPSVCMCFAGFRRITPADAGKTCLPRRFRRIQQDHPRGCGENYATYQLTFNGNRITPADAGKTTVNNLRQRVNEDHPRGCGENKVDFALAFPQRGSPPRMRGKRTEFATGAVRDRITPADAGKTRCDAARSAVSEDHPRGCGENRYGVTRQSASIGSPPRMRGKPSLPTYPRSRRRITPADAGKTKIFSAGSG